MDLKKKRKKLYSCEWKIDSRNIQLVLLIFFHYWFMRGPFRKLPWIINCIWTVCLLFAQGILQHDWWTCFPTMSFSYPLMQNPRLLLQAVWAHWRRKTGPIKSLPPRHYVASTCKKAYPYRLQLFTAPHLLDLWILETKYMKLIDTNVHKLQKKCGKGIGGTFPTSIKFIVPKPNASYILSPYNPWKKKFKEKIRRR